MKIVTTLEDIPPLSGPIALTIGMFDGVHLGHQMLLGKLDKFKRKHAGSAVLLTFSNHPSSLLTPNSPIPLILSLKHRLSLIQEEIDLTIVLPFTQSFANQPYDLFFSTLRKHLPFEILIVGEDARFGKGRQGTPEIIHTLPWKTEYLSKETYHKEPISSGAIRQALTSRDLKKARKMLGRPYSIRLPFLKSHLIHETGDQFQYVTGTHGLCLLPTAAYSVELLSEKKSIPAIALYRGTKSITGETQLNLSLLFEKEIPDTPEIEIVFHSYLHDEVEPERILSTKASLLKSLKAEFFPS